MSTFWILAGLLVVLALVFVLPPLLRKPRISGVQPDRLNVQVIKDQLDELRADLDAGRLDETAYAAARHDLERSLLDDVEKAGSPPPQGEARSGRWMALLLLLVVPALAVTLYQQLGAEQTLERIAAGRAALQAAGNSPHALEAMIEKLAQRMQQEPDNVEGWALLGRSYAAIDRFSDSAAAYRHALELAPDNADILSSYADVLVTVNNGAFTDEVGQLLDRALAADPGHLKALWLRGHWKYRHGDIPGAVEDWQAVAAALPPGDQNLPTIQRQIQLAQSRTGQQPLEPIAQAAGASSADASAQGDARIQVQVSLDPALAGKVSPDDTLFIFARAVQGPRMPLAIVRKRAGDLPVTVTLDDSQAMSPAMKLSRFPEVAVGARISKSGQAMPAGGDLQGSVSPVHTADGDARVTINEVVPGSGAAGASAAPAAPVETAASGGGQVQVQVSLDPALAGKVSPDDTLFIFARAVQGPRMPLAIVRKRAGDLPVTVTLNDSQAMSPAMKLSGFPEVTVEARISKSGQAMPASGDLQGSVSPVHTADGDAKVTIDQTVP